jgi:hypothetical protein
MEFPKDRELNPLAIELIAIKIVLRSLIAHMTVDDPDNASAAIDALFARVERDLRRAPGGPQPLAESESASDAVRAAALAFLAGLKPNGRVV